MSWLCFEQWSVQQCQEKKAWVSTWVRFNITEQFNIQYVYAGNLNMKHQSKTYCNKDCENVTLADINVLTHYVFKKSTRYVFCWFFISSNNLRVMIFHATWLPGSEAQITSAQKCVVWVVFHILKILKQFFHRPDTQSSQCSLCTRLWINTQYWKHIDVIVQMFSSICFHILSVTKFYSLILASDQLIGCECKLCRITASCVWVCVFFSQKIIICQVRAWKVTVDFSTGKLPTAAGCGFLPYGHGLLVVLTCFLFLFLL